MVSCRYNKANTESSPKTFSKTRNKLKISIRNDDLQATPIVQQKLPAEDISLIFGNVSLVL